MTVQDNLNLIREMYEALNNKDYARAFSLHSEDHLRYDSRSPEPMKGLDVYREYTQDFMRAFPDIHVEVVRAFGQEDMVCDEHITTGTHKGPMKSQDGQTIPPSGKSFKIRACHIYKIQAGKIIETSVYIDQMVFLAQLGLTPWG